MTEDIKLKKHAEVLSIAENRAMSKKNTEDFFSVLEEHAFPELVDKYNVPPDVVVDTFIKYNVFFYSKYAYNLGLKLETRFNLSYMLPSFVIGVFVGFGLFLLF